MDMMEMRFRMMAAMGGGNRLPEGWHEMQIINPSAITLGGQLATLLENTLPNCLFAVGVVLDEYSDTLPENSSVFTFTWTGTGAGSRFQRYYNGVSVDARTITDTYACKIAQGTKILIFYHDPLTV